MTEEQKNVVIKRRGSGREFTAYGNSRWKYCSHACYIKDRFGGGGEND